MRFMVVDDSNIVRRKIERALDVPDLEFVGSASNGHEALEEFKTLEPDVVTMDITMPKMDGIQTIERMVAQCPEVRILVISALADKVTAIQAIKKGAYGFLCKPFTDLQLNDALTELIGDLVHG